jgi:hypothetical protein
VSVLTRKQAVSETGLRWHAAHAARQVTPMAQQAAQQAVPLARSAGTTIRHGADEAIARATPLVDAARSWAAPQLEQSAHAISESLAPMISSALISAAHKIDVKPQKSRRRRGVLAGTMLLTAAAGMAAVLMLRRWHDAAGLSSMTPSGGPSDLGSVDASGPTGAEEDAAGGAPDADQDGHPRIV